MKKLFIFLCLILAFGLSAHVGVFFAGKTKVTLGTRVIQESRIGSMLGVSTAGIYRLETLFGLFEKPDLRILQRNFSMTYPAGYTGVTSNTEVVPGAQLHFAIVLRNLAGVPAKNCVIEDIVPQNTHFYSALPPTLVGNCSNVTYEGVTNNAGAGSSIKFRFDLAPSGLVTFSYTVTVD